MNAARPRENIAWSMGSIIAKNGFTVVIFMVLARLIEPAAFGSISITLMAWGLGYSFVDSGFTNVVVRQPHLDRDLLSSLYWWNVGLGVLAAGALALAGPAAAAFFHDPRLAHLFFIASLTLFFLSLGQQFITVLQQQMAFRTIACIEIGTTLAGFGVTLARAFAGAGPASYFEGVLAGNALLALGAFFAARKSFSPRFHFSTAEVKSVINFGLFNTGERCVSFITTNFEKPLIGRLFTMADLGLYTVVNQLVTRPVSLISGAFSRVAYSLYSKVKDDHATLNELYIGYSGKLALITFPMYGFIHLFSDTVITVLFGAKFLSAAAFLTPLCILGALWSIGNPFSAYLMALGKARIGFFMNCVSVIVIAGVLLAGSRFSMQTMLEFWVLAVVIVLLPIEWIMRYRLTKMSLVKYLGKILPTALVVALLAIAGKAVVRDFHLQTGIVRIICSMMAYAAVYGAYALLMYQRVWRKR
jgi:O-antigen/teichoic acid export membrane protein